MIDLRGLTIFEMANNHQGDVEHGLRIIKEMGQLAEAHGVRAAVKLQYRELDSFVHPAHREGSTAKHIGRFLSTRLADADFRRLVEAVTEAGMVTVCTPFDEASVATILDHGIEVIKVASCSAADWPLLEAIAAAGRPVIASTGGLEQVGIDNLVSFFDHRGVPFALLHCVGLYPTPPADQHLRNIATLARRYPHVTVGYSGHEDPDDVLPGALAVGLGAQILERHVGIAPEGESLNAYSMAPAQVDAWLTAVGRARVLLGSDRRTVTFDERESLVTLQRGVFARRRVAQGETLTGDDVYFAMPCEDGQLTSGRFGQLRAEYVASRDYEVDEAVHEQTAPDLYDRVRTIVHDARGMLAEAGVVLTEGAEVELSHHYGLEHFAEHGCLIVNLVNREYCKKIIVVFPGQSHPEQKHLRKEETFHVLSGEVRMTLNGVERVARRGDIVTIERGVPHAFTSAAGAIIEEVSTTHHRDDSFYTDPRISQQDPMQRKTVIDSF